MAARSRKSFSNDKKVKNWGSIFQRFESKPRLGGEGVVSAEAHLIGNKAIRKQGRDDNEVQVIPCIY
jgi:hypothetical protein